MFNILFCLYFALNQVNCRDKKSESDLIFQEDFPDISSTCSNEISSDEERESNIKHKKNQQNTKINGKTNKYDFANEKYIEKPKSINNLNTLPDLDANENAKKDDIEESNKKIMPDNTNDHSVLDVEEAFKENQKSSNEGNDEKNLKSKHSDHFLDAKHSDYNNKSSKKNTGRENKTKDTVEINFTKHKKRTDREKVRRRKKRNIRIRSVRKNSIQKDNVKSKRNFKNFIVHEDIL